MKMTQSRKIMSGLLTKNTTFRLYVTGDFGARELATLLSKLQIDMKMLIDEEAKS